MNSSNNINNIRNFNALKNY